MNPDLHLPRFVKRRVDRILLVASADAWSYVNTSLNPADVGTRVESVKWSSSHLLWLKGPDFLLQKGVEYQPYVSPVTVHRASVGGDHCKILAVEVWIDSLRSRRIFTY